MHFIYFQTFYLVKEKKEKKEKIIRFRIEHLLLSLYGGINFKEIIVV